MYKFCVIRQYRVCKAVGMRFEYVDSDHVKMVCPETRAYVYIGNTSGHESKEQLQELIRARRAAERRQAFKCVQGGLSWLPSTIQLQPQGKLRLVVDNTKKAA